MKELDFLPDWYRADRQRRRRQHRHYILFGLIVVLLAGWSFMLDRTVSDLHARNSRTAMDIAQAQQTMQASMELELQIDTLRRQADILKALTPRTAISAILGELSHCVGEQVILGRVLLIQESIKETQRSTATLSAVPLRIGAAQPEGPSPLPNTPQRVNLTLTGIAGGGAQVARLIERLETSSYFETVSPGFSRAKKIGDKTVTEFEIVCTVADYTLQR